MMKKTYRIRELLVAFLSLVSFLVIEARLYYVQVHRRDHYIERARGQQFLVKKLLPKRGDILDREGQILATSTTYHSIAFEPPYGGRSSGGPGSAEWRKPLTPEFVTDLAQVLDVSVARVERALAKSHHARIVDMAPPETVQTVLLLLNEHKVPRSLFSFGEQSKRLYPREELVAPLLGITGIDPFGQNVGLEGLEFRFNDTLKGEYTTQTLQTTLKHGELQALDDQTVRRSYGNSLVLTIDSQIQRAARQALQRQITRTEAKSGVVVVMDVRTGELLAVVSLPDFDPDNLNRDAYNNLRNRALTDPIEIGSVMKILTTSILLDHNLLSVEEMIDCQNGYAVIDGRVFRDSHAQGVVPFRMAFAESSNIGMATVGLRIEPSLYYESLRRFGLGAPLGVDLPGESGGILRPVNQWSRLSRTSLPVGYETSLTALQVVTAVAAIGNGGVRMHPQIVKRVVSFEGRTLEEFEPQEVVRVASEKTARTMLELMQTVVREGTGKGARVPGYTVAGKTGTTRKHTEDRRYIASFAGLIPATDPRLAIYCFVNEPDPKIDFYGGRIAAPVFSEVAAESVRILGIPPDAPEPADPPAEVNATEEQNDAFLVADSGRPGRELVEGTDATQENAEEAAPAEDEVNDWSEADGREEAQVALTAAVAQGGMPYCLGLTMPEVLEKAARADLPIKMVGSGVAIRQSPPPGTPMTPGREAMVVFAAPSQTLTAAKPAGEAAERGGSALPDL